MTRFETLNNQSLGGRFLGDNGATFHLTNDELKLLFSLDEETEVVSDNMWFGTAGDLLDLWFKGNKASEEQMQRRFNKSLDDSLHFKSKKLTFVTDEGLKTKVKFTR